MPKLISLFTNPKTLRLGYIEDTGFFFTAIHDETTIVAPVGTAMAAALIMRANHIEHFDYTNELLDHPTALREFIDTAKHIGLVV